MHRLLKDNSTNNLLAQIVEVIKEKQGEEITTIDFSKIPNMVSNYFVVCHADSGLQMQSILSAIERVTREKLNMRPFSIEGATYNEWIIVDYIDVVVHIFTPDKRACFDLEALWADAIIRRID